jgi:hypothetical protein
MNQGDDPDAAGFLHRESQGFPASAGQTRRVDSWGAGKSLDAPRAGHGMDFVTQERYLPPIAGNAKQSPQVINERAQHAPCVRNREDRTAGPPKRATKPACSSPNTICYDATRE